MWCSMMKVAIMVVVRIVPMSMTWVWMTCMICTWSIGFPGSVRMKPKSTMQVRVMMMRILGWVMSTSTCGTCCTW